MIPVAAPWIAPEDVEAVTDAAANGWGERANFYHERFEREFATYVDREHAIALPSCTSALHLALLALDIGPGDQVVVPDSTWIASSAPISYVGATPVFADVDPVSWCITGPGLEECISERTRAVIAVDLYGGMPDMETVLDVAERSSTSVIEDAAEALGSEYRGRRAGGFGEVGTFSFHGSKTLTTGEGGMLVTDRTDVRARVLQLRDHGRPPGDRRFWNSEVAFKYKMSGMQAALGLAQLRRVEEIVAAKRRIAGWYLERLKGREELTLNAEPADVKSTYWMVTVLLPKSSAINRDRVIQELYARGVDSRPFFHPLSSLPAYTDAEDAPRARGRNHVARDLGRRGLNLPSGPALSEEDVERVCEALVDALTGTRLSSSRANSTAA